MASISLDTWKKQQQGLLDSLENYRRVAVSADIALDDLEVSLKSENRATPKNLARIAWLKKNIPRYKSDLKSAEKSIKKLVKALARHNKSKPV